MNSHIHMKLSAAHEVSPLVVKFEIHNRLKAVRDHLKLSQREMAEVMDVQQGTYSAYETGVRDMSLSAFRNMVAKLNIDTEWMLFGETRPSGRDSL